MVAFQFPELSTYRYSSSDATKRWAVENPETGKVLHSNRCAGTPILPFRVPSQHKVLTTLQSGDASTVDAAARASQVAFEERWRPLSPAERSAYLLRCADALEQRADELAWLLCLKTPWCASRWACAPAVLPFNRPPIYTRPARSRPRWRPAGEHLRPEARGAGPAGGHPDLRDRGRGGSCPGDVVAVSCRGLRPPRPRPPWSRTRWSAKVSFNGVYDRFVERLAAGVGRIKMGGGLDPATHVGPQVSRVQQQQRLLERELPEDPKCTDGFFTPATLFADVREDMRIAKEEMFGAIVTVMPFDTFKNAVRITNSVEHSLVAVVFTQDQLKANRFVRAADVGMINNFVRNVLGTPFGGVKHSGYGREHLIETLSEWTQPQAIHTPSGIGKAMEWQVVAEIFGASGSDVAQ